MLFPHASCTRSCLCLKLDWWQHWPQHCPRSNRNLAATEWTYSLSDNIHSVVARCLLLHGQCCCLYAVAAGPKAGPATSLPAFLAREFFVWFFVGLCFSLWRMVRMLYYGWASGMVQSFSPPLTPLKILAITASTIFTLTIFLIPAALPQVATILYLQRDLEHLAAELMRAVNVGAAEEFKHLSGKVSSTKRRWEGFLFWALFVERHRHHHVCPPRGVRIQPCNCGHECSDELGWSASGSLPVVAGRMCC